MLRAFGTWPAANSCGSRTSTIVQAWVPTASSKSPKLTMSGSEPAPKRENMFQDILPPEFTGRLRRGDLYGARSACFEAFLVRRYRPWVETNCGDVATPRHRDPFPWPC